jgi:hypothetical protein
MTIFPRKESQKHRPYFSAFFIMPGPISSIEHRGTNSPSESSIPSLLLNVKMPASLWLAMRRAHVVL